MNLSPFLSIQRSCNETLPWSKERLSQAGLRCVQTFDLHTARAGLHDCPCPHHGTEQCNCQMVVMLIYGEFDEPVTLILHGNDGQTWLSIADSPRPGSATQLTRAIQRALEVKVPAPKDS